MQKFLFRGFAAFALLCPLAFTETVSLMNPPPLEDAPRVITLILRDIRPIGDFFGHLYLTLSPDGEEIQVRAAADYNERSENRVVVRSFSLEGPNLVLEADVTIGPDGARRGRAHFPTPPDAFSLTVRAELAEDWSDPPENRDAFMPGWRKDTPQTAGRAVRGRYEGTWTWRDEPQAVSGEVSGSWNHGAVPGSWGAAGPAWVSGGEEGLIALRAFLPEGVRVEGIEAWAETRWEDPPIVPAAGTVRVSARGTGQNGAASLSIMLQTERGWFARVNAMPLTESMQTVEVDLAAFGSRWRPFAGSELRAARVGVVNGSGVGVVELEFEGLEIVAGEAPPEPGPVTVVVRHETAWNFNGAGEVPKGLFGFHDVGENNPRAAREGEPDYVEMMRILNPGSLRPLTHTGFGGRPVSDEEAARLMDLEQRDPNPPDTPFFRRAVAGNAVDKVVWTHTMDLWARPSWLDRGVAPVARDVEVFYRNLAARAWIPGDDYNVLRYLEVWNEPFMWGRHINMGFRTPPGATDITDETQYGYIPGKVGADAWSEIFLAAVRGARGVNPHVKLGGPSVPNFGSHDYMDFRNYTLRMLERTGDQLDFITEHHYGGDPLTVAAGYEVTRSAMWKLHGRMPPIFNTEANDLGASDAGKAAYNLADILNLIRVNPDISRVRALHACWNGYLRSMGEEHAWRLAAPLRGTLIDTHVDQPRVTAVASHPETGSLVVVGVDHGVGATDVRLPVPAGFTVSELKLLLADAPLEELMIRDVDGAMVPMPARGRTQMVNARPEVEGGFLRFRIPERSAFRVTFHREGYAPARTRKQTLTPTTLFFEELAPGDELPLPVEEVEKDVDRVFLRLVYTGNGEIHFGNRMVALPPGADRSGNAEVTDIELPVLALTESPRLRATSRVEILSASWITE